MATTGAKAAAAKKAERALDLKLHGHTWPQVAEQVGYSNGTTACRAVSRYLKRHPTEGVEDLRQQESLKLDQLERDAWREYRQVRWATCSRGLVTDADDNPVPDNSHRERWAGVLLRIYERRARLLGLDLRQVIIGESEALDEEIEALVAEINANAVIVPPGHPG